MEPASCLGCHRPFEPDELAAEAVCGGVLRNMPEDQAYTSTAYFHEACLADYRGRPPCAFVQFIVARDIPHRETPPDAR